MAIAHDFAYERPGTLSGALALLDEHRSSARILAGGTDLIVHIKEGLAKPELLIDIKDIAALRQLELIEGKLFIGAAVSFAELIDSPLIKEHIPMLLDAARTVASTGVRTRATLAGNICSAVPSLDSAPPLLCYGALVHCESLAGGRDVPIGDWFLAPRKTALKDNELVTGISIPLPDEDSAGIYLKLGRYNGEDLAQAGWGILCDKRGNYRIAHCALAPVPARALLIEALLQGKELSEELIAEAVALVEREINPITDIRASKEYRVHVSGVMLKRGLKSVRERLLGKDIEPRELLGGLA